MFLDVRPFVEILLNVLQRASEASIWITGLGFEGCRRQTRGIALIGHSSTTGIQAERRM